MPRISRRTLLKSAGAVSTGAVGALSTPAIAQTAPSVRWRLATSWPKSLDTLYGGAERFAAFVADATDDKFQIECFPAGAIQGVVCQTLCKRADGRGRVVATEVMIATPGIRNLIREGKTHQIYSAMQAGAQHGMHTLDQHLAELVRTGQITWEHGLEKCHHVEDYQRLTGRA